MKDMNWVCHSDLPHKEKFHGPIMNLIGNYYEPHEILILGHLYGISYHDNGTYEKFKFLRDSI